MSRAYPGICGTARDAISPIESITVSASITETMWSCNVHGPTGHPPVTTYTPVVNKTAGGSGTATWTRVRWSGPTPPTLEANQFYMIQETCCDPPSFVFSGNEQGASGTPTASTCTLYSATGGVEGTCAGEFDFSVSVFSNGDGTYVVGMTASVGFPQSPGSICFACNESMTYPEEPEVTVSLDGLMGTHSFSDSLTHSSCPPSPMTQPFDLTFSGSVSIS
jgi:hypothetical protein